MLEPERSSKVRATPSIVRAIARIIVYNFLLTRGNIVPSSVGGVPVLARFRFCVGFFVVGEDGSAKMTMMMVPLTGRKSYVVGDRARYHISEMKRS